MSSTEYKDFPRAAVDLMKNGQKLSSAEIDECLNTCRMNKNQLKIFADAVVDRVVFSGNDLALRYAMCHARILNEITLYRMSLLSPYSVKHLADIERGNTAAVTPAECRFFNALLGLDFKPSVQYMLCETSGDGMLLPLSQMDSFSNLQNLSDYAERKCVKKFQNGELYGLNGIVIEADAEQIGLEYYGRVFMLVSELDEITAKHLSLCRMDDESYLVLQPVQNGFQNADGKVFGQERVLWRLPVRQLILKVF